MADNKRLYVGGLFPEVKEGELKDRFSKFGNITKIEIKSKPSLEEGKPNTFAFIDIDITSINLVKCFSVLSNCKWKGYAITLQVAKESFLDRLKKEKNGFNKSSDTKNSNFEPISNSRVKNIDEHSEPSELNQCENEHEKTLKSKPINDDYVNVDVEYAPKKDNAFNSTSNKSSESSQISSKKNFTSSCLDPNGSRDVVSRLEMFSGSVWSDDKVDVADKRYTSLANEKRLKSIQQKLDLEKSRERLISNALKITLDVKSCKPKLIFEEDGNVKDKQNCDGNINAKQGTLFDEESSDDDDNINDAFAHKPQFEGESGSQLLELQSRFGNDDRFKFDARFKDTKSDNLNGNDDDEEGRLEKIRNLRILEAIAGKPLGLTKRVGDKNTLIKRYDPTNPNCSRLEISQDKSEHLTSKVKIPTESKPIEMEVENETLEPVGTDRFFKVDSNLANLFKKEKKSETSFNVSNLFEFSPAVDHNSTAEKEQITKTVSKINENNVRTAWAGNPFRYDSSDDEDVEDAKEFSTKTSNEIVKQRFFFSNNDQRFKDGLSFYKTSDEVIDSSKWITQKKRVTEMIKHRRKQLRRKEVNKQILLKKQRKSKNKRKFKKSIKGKR